MTWRAALCRAACGTSLTLEQNRAVSLMSLVTLVLFQLWQSILRKKGLSHDLCKTRWGSGGTCLIRRDSLLIKPVNFHLFRTLRCPPSPSVVEPGWKTSAPWEVRTLSSSAAVMGPRRRSGWVCVYACGVKEYKLLSFIFKGIGIIFA